MKNSGGLIPLFFLGVMLICFVVSAITYAANKAFPGPTPTPDMAQQAMSVIGEQSEAIGEQAKAIGELAETVGEQSNRIVDQSESIEGLAMTQVAKAEEDARQAENFAGAIPWALFGGVLLLLLLIVSARK